MYVFLLNKISFFSLSRVCNKFQMHSPTNKIITQQLFRHLIYSTDFDITCLRFIVIKIIELLRCKCILEMPECVCLHNKEFDDIFHHKWLSNTDQFNAFIYGLQFWLFKKHAQLSNQQKWRASTKRPIKQLRINWIQFN